MEDKQASMRSPQESTPSSDSEAPPLPTLWEDCADAEGGVRLSTQDQDNGFNHSDSDSDDTTPDTNEEEAYAAAPRPQGTYKPTPVKHTENKNGATGNPQLASTTTLSNPFTTTTTTTTTTTPSWRTLGFSNPRAPMVKRFDPRPTHADYPQNAQGHATSRALIHPVLPLSTPQTGTSRPLPAPQSAQCSIFQPAVDARQRDMWLLGFGAARGRAPNVLPGGVGGEAGRGQGGGQRGGRGQRRGRGRGEGKRGGGV